MGEQFHPGNAPAWLFVFLGRLWGGVLFPGRFSRIWTWIPLNWTAVSLKDLDSVKAQNVVASFVELADNLAIHTVAEGIESQDQVDFLRSDSLRYDSRICVFHAIAHP